ncbi:MAG: hypothetical protein ACI4UH_07395 [Dorea sp.]
MDSLYVIRQKLQEVYAAHSIVFDKIIQFVLALITFFLINNNIGFMKLAAQPFITLALAVICTFFPLTMTIVVAAVLVLVHMYAASLGLLIVTVLVFLVMFALYFRLTPKMALVVILTPVAFMLKIPYAIPIAYALIASPICIIAICCGTVVYFMMEYVKKAVPALQSGEVAGILEQISAYIKQVFLNKELWVIISAFIICFLLVYTIRRQAIDHAWKIAVVAGAVANVIVITVGDIALGVNTSFGSLIIGNIAAIIIGGVLELFFFSVDYARSENLQFEDDEYYYYVKAVPKLSVSTPEKTVKRINERQETEIIDADEVRRRTARVEKTAARPSDEKKTEGKRSVPKQNVKRPAKRPATKKGPSAKRHDMDDVDKMLLTQSLRKELNLDD